MQVMGEWPQRATAWPGHETELNRPRAGADCTLMAGHQPNMLRPCGRLATSPTRANSGLPRTTNRSRATSLHMVVAGARPTEVFSVSDTTSPPKTNV
jgi:hypothetical protein